MSNTDTFNPLAQAGGLSDFEDDQLDAPYSGEEPAPLEAERKILDSLKDTLKKPNVIEHISIRVPGRDDPKISIIALPDFEWEQFEAWAKSAKNRQAKGKDKDVTRPRILADIVLSHTVTGIKLNGVEVKSPSGESYPLTSKTLQGMLEANNVRDAIRKLFASDGHVIAALTSIMEAAGYGDVDLEDDSETFRDDDEVSGE